MQVAPILKRFWNGWGVKGEESVLGIDIGSSAIKIVELRRELLRPRLETYGTIELTKQTVELQSGNPTSFLASTLLDLIHEVGTHGRKGGMSLPFSSTFVTIIESLKRDEGEARKIIEAEARQYVPVDLGQVSLVWQILPEERQESAFAHAEQRSAESAHKQKLLLVAVRNDTLEKYEHIAWQTNIGIGFFETELFSSIRSLCGKSGEALLCIDIGASGAKIYIIDEHRIPRATRFIANKADVYRVAKEMVTEYHNTSSTKVVMRALLSGGGARTPNALEEAQKILNQKVELANPFAAVEGPMILEDVLRDVGPLYTVACGLALRALDEL